MEIWATWFDSTTGLHSVFLAKVVATLLIGCFFWLVQRGINQLLSKQVSDPNVRYNWKKGTQYVLSAFGLILIGRVWIEEFHQVLTVLAVVAVAVAISLKEVFMNLTGWGIIVWRNLFVVGDRVQIASTHGDVVGIGIQYLTLMEINDWASNNQSTGRLVKVPNSLVIIHPVANYTKSFPYLWQDLEVLITPNSNWPKAKEILQAIGEKHTAHLAEEARHSLDQVRDEVIIFRELTPVVYMSVKQLKPSGIRLGLRYLCAPRNRRTSETQLWKDILEELGQCEDVELIFD